MEELIPLAAVLGTAAVICILFWFKHRNRSEVQQTIRAALDKGHELSPAVIDRLGHPKESNDKDLRLGIIWLAVAVGLVMFGYGIPDDEATEVMRGIASFPFAMGIAYLILHKFSDRN